MPRAQVQFQSWRAVPAQEKLPGRTGGPAPCPDAVFDSGPLALTSSQWGGSGKTAFSWLQNRSIHQWCSLPHLSRSIRKVLMPQIICMSVCSGLLFNVSALCGIFQRKLCIHFWVVLSQLLAFHCCDAGKVWGSGYAFCRTVILYFITKKDQLWKARLNHSFHFLMGFGWIE